MNFLSLIPIIMCSKLREIIIPVIESPQFLPHVECAAIIDARLQAFSTRLLTLRTFPDCLP